jgi:hypothetical protein
MTSEHFVGRHEAVERLQAVLKEQTRADGRLTIQSIEGPGGIGKTFLFDYVITAMDLTDRHYLRFKIDGNEPSAISLVRLISRMVDSADAKEIRNHPAGYYFPTIARIIKAIETIKSEAVAEFQKRHPSEQDGHLAISRFLDWAFKTGHRINDVAPITKRYVNVKELEKWQKSLQAEVPTMASFREETPGVLERLGLGGSTALRNSIKENACHPLADALLSDLSAILAGYRPQDRYKPAHSKIKGIDRLLLVIDDFEKLQESLGEFSVSYFLSALKNADFESVVIILGRDRLEATHPAWDQHLKSALLKRIELDPLSRKEMDELVESYGVRNQSEKERAWRDTQGYPFYVQLWVEEVESGGRSAVMLKRFYDRITRWMSDREKAWLHFTLFLDEVNKRSLQNMTGDVEEAESAFRWFEREGSVRDTIGGVFRVREYLRSRLIDYLRISDPDKYEDLERKGRLLTNRYRA